jgi:hypothetical protein
MLFNSYAFIFAFTPIVVVEAVTRPVPCQNLDKIALRHQKIANFVVIGSEISLSAGISGVETIAFNVLDEIWSEAHFAERLFSRAVS